MDLHLGKASLGLQSALYAARHRIQQMIEQREPLRDMLTYLVGTAEELAGGRTVSSILLLDERGLLRNGASPNLPADYLDAIDRLKPDANVGTCAAAAAIGEMVITPDFRADRRWAELRHLPLSLGFAGAWSLPIKSRTARVLGTFGTYFREQRVPTPPEREAVAGLAAAAALAIESSRPLPAP